MFEPVGKSLINGWKQNDYLKTTLKTGGTLLNPHLNVWTCLENNHGSCKCYWI